MSQPRHPSIPVGDDYFISGATFGALSQITIRDAQHTTLVTLNLTPAAVHELRNATIRLAASLDAQAIEAAGVEVDIPVTDERTFPEALAIVRTYSGTTYQVNS